MKLPAIFLALAVLPAFPAAAQVVSVRSVNIEEGGDEDGPGWQTRAVLAVPPETGRILSFDSKKSTVEEVTDAATGQPVKVKTKLMAPGSARNLVENGDFGIHFTVTAPPETSNAWLKIKGTLVFKTVAEMRKQKVAFKLADGTTFKVGEFFLTVKDVGKRGDSVGFTLAREDGSFAPISDIQFSDDQGVPILVNRTGSGTSTRNNQIISERRIYRCPEDLEELHAEFEIVLREGAAEVPFDVSVPVNP